MWGKTAQHKYSLPASPQVSSTKPTTAKILQLVRYGLTEEKEKKLHSDNPNVSQQGVLKV